MRTKIGKMLMSVSYKTIIIVLSIASCFVGCVVSTTNVLEPKLLQGFDASVFGALVLLYALIVLSNLINKSFAKTYRMKICNDLYDKYLDRALSSKMPDIQKVSTGKIFDAVKSLAMLKGDFIVSLISLMPTFFPFITLIVKEWMYSPLISIISLISTFGCFAVLRIKKLWEWEGEAKTVKAEMQGITVDNFSNMKTVKYLKQCQYARDRLRDSQVRSSPYMINIYGAFVWRFCEIMSLGALLINAFLARHNLELLAFIFLSNYAIENMRTHLTNLSEAWVEIKAQEDILKPLKGDDTEPTLALGPNDSIVLDNVMFDYGEGTEKFYIDHLEFPYKSRTLVTGESGEGKSSLANLLAGGIKPGTGIVPRFKLFYIWQETEVLDDNLWNNIVFGNSEGVSEREVLELFEELNMINWFSKLPEGFDTLVGERGCRLSSGQKQRINIIRLILCMRYHPENVFIIDEITSNLDSYTRDLAIDLIDRECNSTLICISHNDGFDQICQSGIIVEKHRFYVKDLVNS